MLIAIVIKTALFLHFFQLEGDKLFQAIGAKNLVEGNGLTFTHVQPADLSSQVYERVNRWPPGYSLLVAGAYAITRNLVWACALLDIFSVLFFFFVLNKLFKTLSLPWYLKGMLVLFLGCTFDFYIGKPTDLLAAAAVLYSCDLLINFYTDSKRNVAFGFVVGLASSLPVLFRFMYLPVVFVPALVLIASGLKSGDTRIKRGGVNALISTVAVTGATFLFQKLYTGAASYILSSGSGFYFANLLAIYPAVLNAVVDLNFTLQQISAMVNVSFYKLYDYAKVINVLLLLYAFLWVYRPIASDSSRWALKWKLFLLSAALINVAILFMLAILSVTNSSHSVVPGDTTEWTFIGDGRFFSLLMILTPVIIGYNLFCNKWKLQRMYQKVLRVLCVFLFIFQVAHTSYFLLRRFAPMQLKGGNVLITAGVADYMMDQIRMSQNDGMDVVLTSHDETVSNWATLHGAKGMLRAVELKSVRTSSKKPTIIFILIKKSMLPYYNPILHNSGVGVKQEIGELVIFSRLINAND